VRAPTAIVREWHDAVNAGDAERALALVAEDVEVAGPRGGGRGRALLADWVRGAGITLEPLRVIADGGSVVVEQSARWGPGEPQRVATVFAVRDGLITRVARHPDLAGALAATGMADAGAA
jgi:ketosteroid isomerase-like protein